MIPDAAAWSRIACAIGCAERGSTEAASEITAAASAPSKAMTSTTCGLPSGKARLAKANNVEKISDGTPKS